MGCWLSHGVRPTACDADIARDPPSDNMLQTLPPLHGSALTQLDLSRNRFFFSQCSKAALTSAIDRACQRSCLTYCSPRFVLLFPLSAQTSRREHRGLKDDPEVDSTTFLCARHAMSGTNIPFGAARLRFLRLSHNRCPPPSPCASTMRCPVLTFQANAPNRLTCFPEEIDAAKALVLLVSSGLRAVRCPALTSCVVGQDVSFNNISTIPVEIRRCVVHCFGCRSA